MTTTERRMLELILQRRLSETEAEELHHRAIADMRIGAAMQELRRDNPAAVSTQWGRA